MDLLDLYLKGGIMMHAILACTVVGVYVSIERYRVFRQAQLEVGQFMIKLKSFFHKGDMSALLVYCSQKHVPIARIICRGILKADLGDILVRKEVETAGREEVYHLESHLWMLAGVAGLAPMLGFLGTAIGMVGMFQSVQHLHVFSNPDDFASGMKGAMVPTVFGLAAGILAFGSYSYFRSRLGTFVHEIELSTTAFLDLFERRAEVSRRDSSSQESTTRKALVYEDDEYFRRKA